MKKIKALLIKPVAILVGLPFYFHAKKLAKAQLIDAHVRAQMASVVDDMTGRIDGLIAQADIVLDRLDIPKGDA